MMEMFVFPILYTKVFIYLYKFQQIGRRWINSLEYFHLSFEVVFPLTIIIIIVIKKIIIIVNNNNNNNNS